MHEMPRIYILLPRYRKIFHDRMTSQSSFTKSRNSLHKDIHVESEKLRLGINNVVFFIFIQDIPIIKI